jgi:APA family basic amino acid/polyamine antiporter
MKADLPNSPADERLERAIGPWGLGANAVNGAIGAGIFVLPALVAAVLGPSAILAYLICGLATALVLTCFIEIGTVVKRSGGAVAYVEEAFGPLMGFVAWLLYSVGFLTTSNAAIGNVLIDSAASVVPGIGHGPLRVLALLVLFAGLAAVNIAGVRQGIAFAVISTAGKLLPLLFLIGGGVIVMNWHELRWTGWPAADKLGEASLILFFAFQGAEAALTPSAEIRDPERNVPPAIFAATACVIFIYVAIHAVSQGVLGGELARQTGGALPAVGERIAGTAGRSLILAGTAISILGALGCGMLAAPRAFFLVAQDGLLPAPLAAVHPRYRTPHVAILTVAVLSFALAVSGAFKSLAVLSSSSTLCVYLAVSLGALRLRYTRRRAPGAFRAPGGPLIPILGAATVLWMLVHSTRREAGALVATLAAATIYYAVHRRVNSRTAR